MLKTHILLAGSWILYYFFHSLLASEIVKGRLKRIGSYRLLYSTFSVFGLLPIALFLIANPGKPIFITNIWTNVAAFAFFLAGTIIIYLSFKYFSVRQFLGVNPLGKGNKLIKEGLHRYVRHPIYSGTIMIFVGILLFRPTSGMGLTFVVMCLYLPIGIHLEEKKLLKEFGVDYLRYKSEVPAIFPKLFF